MPFCSSIGLAQSDWLTTSQNITMTFYTIQTPLLRNLAIFYGYCSFVETFWTLTFVFWFIEIWAFNFSNTQETTFQVCSIFYRTWWSTWSHFTCSSGWISSKRTASRQTWSRANHCLVCCSNWQSETHFRWLAWLASCIISTLGASS